MGEDKVTSFLTIQQVVKSFLNERGEKSLTNYEKYINLACEGFSELSIYNLNSINVEYITVNSETNVAILPVDFISMVKIGVNVNGRMWTLTVNNDILMPRPETICQNPIVTPTEVDLNALGGYWFAPHWYNGGWVDTLYGVGGGINSAYYRIDEKNGIILFSGQVYNNEIVLEYISSGVKAGGSAIPRSARPALKAYLHWKAIYYDTRYSRGDRDTAKRDYEEAAHALSMLTYSFTKDEFLDTVRGNYSQAPKR